MIKIRQATLEPQDPNRVCEYESEWPLSLLAMESRHAWPLAC